jgi:hypothetical protein
LPWWLGPGATGVAGCDRSLPVEEGVGEALSRSLGGEEEKEKKDEEEKEDKEKEDEEE